jgi:hypothetical protein
MFESKFLALIVAAALNPLVARAPEPHGAVPANCEVSDRPPVTRVAAAEPAPEDEVVPLPRVRPSATTPAATRQTQTNELEEVRRALARNDRAEFDAALAQARQAGAATRVYDDIARLWDAQFESPFFAEGSEPHRIASGYPGYEAAVRRNVFTDARGRKFYPAAETRAFVATQAGVSTAAPSTPSTRRASASPSSSPSPSATTSRRRQPSLSTSRQTTTPRKSTPSKSSSPVARRSSAAAQEAPHPIPSAPPRIAATEPAPVVPPAADTSPAEAPPVAGSSSDTVAPPVTETVTPTASDEATTIADTTTTAATPATTTTAAPSKGRSIILPAILILIGLGVLILLFRTAK